MRKYWLFTLASIPFMLLAQNLVPNPGFEGYGEWIGSLEHCGLQRVDDWFTPYYSSDYFHRDFNDTLPSRGVPYNSKGYQEAHSGNAYVGGGPLIIGSIFGNHAEYFSVEMLDTLKQDSFYYVNLFISKANIAVSSLGDFGVLFLEDSPGYGNCVTTEPVPEIIIAEPQLKYQGDFLSDTTNWMPISWVYQAQGNELFLMLGIFDTPENIIFEAPGDQMYYYIDDVSVKPIPQALVEPLAADTLWWCINDTATLSASGLHSSYLWNTGDTTVSIEVAAAGWYWVEAVVDECILLRDSIWVGEVAPENLDLGPAEWSLCAADFPVELGTGSPLGDFIWSTGAQTPIIAATQAGIYTVEQLHPCGIFRDTILLLLDDPPLLALAADSLVCAADFQPFLLSATAGFNSYQWSTGDTLINTWVAGEGNYSLVATHFCGMQMADFELQFLDPPALLQQLDTVICPGATLAYTAPLGYDSYSWSHGPATAEVILTDTGTYELLAQHYCGAATAQLIVSYGAPLQIVVPEIPVLRLGETIELSPVVLSGNPQSWRWSPAQWLSCADCPDPLVQPLSSITYELEVADVYGCLAFESIHIQLDASDTGVYIPTAFSPNGDGINDNFEWYSGEAVVALEDWQVYDRWGSLVWQYSSVAQGAANWNGQIAGKPAQQGVYVWQARVRLINGEERSLQGEVLLVR